MSDFYWGVLLGFGGGIVVCLGFFWANRIRSRPVVVAEPPTKDQEVGAQLLDTLLHDPLEELRQNLRMKFLHDEVKINRAIEFERERAPTASEEELMKAAIYRWERENR
jgi:hypothetical protein